MCFSESPNILKKQMVKLFRKAEMHKSTRQFSHGLDLKILPFDCLSGSHKQFCIVIC